MTTIQMLTVRTNAALGRLATLQKRAARATESTAPIIRPALKELSEALEELRVANEQLQQQLDELSQARQKTQAALDRYEELNNVLPIPVLRCNELGEIEEANAAAAALLNVSVPHLPGRELVLFMSDRQKFLEAVKALHQRLTMIVELAVTVRPRERRAREMRLVGRRLQHDERTVWFLLPVENAANAAV